MVASIRFRFLLLAALPGLTMAQVGPTSGGNGTPINSYTVAGLPGTASVGRLVVVTNASTAGSCTIGGGTALSLCRWSGAAWATVGGSGGSGTTITPYAVSGLPVSPSNGLFAIVTDASPGGSCTVGGGTGKSVCFSAGGAWIPIGSVIDASEIITGTLSHARLPGLLSGDIPANTANTSGNAATATALAASPANCSSGQAPTGVNAGGVAQNCGSNVIAPASGGTGEGGTFTGVRKANSAGADTQAAADTDFAATPGSVTVMQGVLAGTYTSGITAAGSSTQTCNLALGGGATATVALTGTNTIAGGTALTITAAGGNATVPTTATVGNGTAACTGTAVVAITSVSNTYGSVAGANVMTLTLGANVSSSSNPTGATTDKLYTIVESQDSNGTHAVSQPAAFSNFPPICPDANSINVITAFLSGGVYQPLAATNTSGHGCVTLGSAPGAAPTVNTMGYPFYSLTDQDFEMKIFGGGLMKGFLEGADCEPVTGICTKTNGTAFAPSATTDATNASNIGSGTVNAARLPLATSAAKGAVQGDGSTLPITAGVISCATGTTTQLGCLKPDGTTITVTSGVISSAASSGVPTIAVANAATTGTTAGKLTKITGAPSTAVTAATTDTGGVIGVTTAGAGTTGNATVQITGSVSCVFDGATTSNHYVQISSATAGDCHDAGASYPTSGQVLGRILSTNGSGGTYTMDLFPAELQANAGTGCTASGSAGVVQASNGSGSCEATSVTDNGTTFAVTEPIDNSTSTIAAKMPVIAGANSSADGRYAYDSTNLFTHVRTSGADSQVNATLASGAFTESKTCTASSAASVAFTSTVTVPANSLTELADVLEIDTLFKFTLSGAEPDQGFDVLIDGSPAFTMLQTPSTTANNGSYLTQRWEITPTTVAAGANSTIVTTMTSPFDGGSNNVGTRIINGTGPLTSFNLGTTHTIGFQMECSSATGVGTAELMLIKAVRK